MTRRAVTPEEALADLAATCPRARLAPPTKASQAAWREQYVVRCRGSVVYSCKTWNPRAEEMARTRAAAYAEHAEVVLIAEGQRSE